MCYATVGFSRLVREKAVRETPVTELKVVAAEDNRPVREEAVESVVASKEPVVFRKSRSRATPPVATSGRTCISRPSGDVESPSGRKDFRDSLCPVPGCGIWSRKMKDHAFKVHLYPFFRLPVKVT